MIYIDEQYRCHTEYTQGRREFDVPALHGKCPEYVSGWFYVPSGESAIVNDRPVYGEAYFNFVPMDELEKAQTTWEHDQLAIMTVECDDLLSNMRTLVDEILEGE